MFERFSGLLGFFVAALWIGAGWYSEYWWNRYAENRTVLALVAGPFVIPIRWMLGTSRIDTTDLEKYLGDHASELVEVEDEDMKKYLKKEKD